MAVEQAATMWTAHMTAWTHTRAKGSKLDQAIQRDLTQKSLQNQEMLHCNMVLLKIITKKKNNNHSFNNILDTVKIQEQLE